jgi:hypothetical protein
MLPGGMPISADNRERLMVGYKLRRDIEDLFPPGTTPAERLIALTIADKANEESRISLVRQGDLCAKTGLGIEGLKKALQRLSSRGLEFRRGCGKGRDGREVFTKPGYEIEYRVPSLNEFLAVHPPLNGGTGVPPSINGRPP